MKILFVTLGTYSRIGGIERFNQRVVRCLADMRGRELKDCHVIALWDTPEDATRAPEGIAFTPASESKVRAALAFARHVRAMRPDVILYGHVLLAPLAGLARVLSPRSRNLLVVHGIEVWGPPYRRIPPGERWIVRTRIDRIISVSKFTVDRMSSVYGIGQDRFRLLPNAIDVSEAPSLGDMQRCESRSEFRLLTVARLVDRYKGCDQVVRALPTVLAEFPNVQYHVIGEGPLKERLRELALAVGVETHVHLHGFVDDQTLESAYEQADLFIMPSTGEGFGIVYLEAWKHRLPVIAGNRDAGAEVVTDGENGLTVDPESLEEIAEAIIRLLRRREWAAQLGQNGFATLRAKYSHEHFRQTLAALLADATIG